AEIHHGQPLVDDLVLVCASAACRAGTPFILRHHELADRESGYGHAMDRTFGRIVARPHLEAARGERDHDGAVLAIAKLLMRVGRRTRRRTGYSRRLLLRRWRIAALPRGRRGWRAWRRSRVSRHWRGGGDGHLRACLVERELAHALGDDVAAL